MISVFFRTFGCQANVADSEKLMQYLRQLGCVIVTDPAQADIIIVNTCAVRDKAEQKIFSYIGALVDYKKEKPYVRIGIIGCVASYRKKEIYTRFDHVSFVWGAKEAMVVLRDYLHDTIAQLEIAKQLYQKDPEAKKWGGQDRDLARVSGKPFETHLEIALRTSSMFLRETGKGVSTKVFEKNSPNPFALRSSEERSFERSDKCASRRTSRRVKFNRSLINIMTGCNNYCTYCIVPFVRGRERSFPMQQILDQVKHAVANGAKEITLIGQNVNSYKDPGTGAGFETLLERVAQITGDFWVRFVSPHPKDMTIDVLDVIAAHTDKLCAFIHLPLQSGSNNILKLMNRKYTREQYLEQVSWVHERLSQATIFTDIIVGFPGETEKDYCDTRDIMEKVRYDQMFSFVYSPRKYTKAAEFHDNCSQKEKQVRLVALQKRQHEICEEQNKKKVGKKFTVLIERQLKSGTFFARTDGNLQVIIDSAQVSINTFIPVFVYDADRVYLYARSTEKGF